MEHKRNIDKKFTNRKKVFFCIKAYDIIAKLYFAQITILIANSNPRGASAGIENYTINNAKFNNYGKIYYILYNLHFNNE